MRFCSTCKCVMGYRNLGEGALELRPVYNFRARLSDHTQKRGENLLDKTFASVTDGQIAAYGLKTDKLLFAIP